MPINILKILVNYHFIKIFSTKIFSTKMFSINANFWCNIKCNDIIFCFFDHKFLFLTWNFCILFINNFSFCWFNELTFDFKFSMVCFCFLYDIVNLLIIESDCSISCAFKALKIWALPFWAASIHYSMDIWKFSIDQKIIKSLLFDEF